MNLVPVHEYRLKLLCLGSEAEYAFEQIVSMFSLQIVTRTKDPNEALAIILNNCNKDMSNFNKGRLLQKIIRLRYKDYASKVFHSSRNKTVRKGIEISKCDILFLHEILSNIYEFKTCIKKHRNPSVNCTGTGSTDHCCVCCQDCQLCCKCLKCLKKICDTENLREALMIIKQFRNMGAHIKPIDCQNMENGNFSCIEISNCRTFNDVLDAFRKNIKVIFKVLLSKGHINSLEYRTRKTNINLITLQDSKHYLELYADRFHHLTTKSWSVPTLQTKPPNVLKFKVDWLESCIAEDDFVVISNLPKIQSIKSWKQLMLKFREKISEVLLTEMETHTSNDVIVTCYDFKPASKEADLLPIEAVFHINFDDVNSFPACYKDFLSDEVESLQETINNALRAVIKDELNIDVLMKWTRYRCASIHFTFEIVRKDSISWSEEDIGRIKKELSGVISIPLSFLPAHKLNITFQKQKFRRWPVLIFNFLISNSELVEHVERILPKIKQNFQDYLLYHFADLLQHEKDGRSELPIYSTFSPTTSKAYSQEMLVREIEESSISDSTKVKSRSFELEAAAKIDIPSEYSFHDLSDLIRDNRLEILSHLLSRNRQLLHMRGEENDTLLHYAVSDNKMEAVKLLLHQNVDVGATDTVGNTAFHVAVWENNAEMLDFLCEHDSSHVEVKNNKNETALMAAERWGRTKCAEVLKKYM